MRCPECISEMDFRSAVSDRDPDNMSVSFFCKECNVGYEGTLMKVKMHGIHKGRVGMTGRPRGPENRPR